LKAGKGMILIVDDESSIRRALRTTLSGLSFEIVEAARGEEALSLVHSLRFDAVLLDSKMPGMGGLETCRALRRAFLKLPILMLTVRDSEDDMVEALNMGADDYITKPFRLRELVARLRVAIRRGQTSEQDEERSLRIADIELDPVRHVVEKAGRRLYLTPTEFKMLRYMMAHADQPIPHARLLQSVWGPEYGNELEYLRTFIRQLRKKIEDDPGAPKYVLTDAHIGYRFNSLTSGG
jgi:two-component system, OmpR family, KDP operon response regulator KdpE